MPAVATRQPKTTQIGTGHLHQALEAARDLSQLQAFCRAHVCTPDQVSADGGKSLDMLRVFDLMRNRGYSISQPVRPQSQMKKGYTTWLVTVTLPAGPACQMAFYTPNSP